MHRFKHFGFTLAEVMLTMTIVGVVAALTLPTLNYQKTKKEYTVKLKNFYSKMNNAVLDMEMDKGSFRDMILPSSKTAGFNWYMENIDPYVGHEFVDEKNKIVYYKDGSRFYVDNLGACLDIMYDVNADKGPNEGGYDTFKFLFCFSDETRKQYFGNADIFFGTPGSTLDAGGNEDLLSAGVSRDTMIYECKNSSRSYCTRLLQNDLWEFKSDYPFKF